MIKETTDQIVLLVVLPQMAAAGEELKALLPMDDKTDEMAVVAEALVASLEVAVSRLGKQRLDRAITAAFQKPETAMYPAAVERVQLDKTEPHQIMPETAVWGYRQA